jgi:glycosyltransferase involved in cell wall biosynthesis
MADSIQEVLQAFAKVKDEIPHWLVIAGEERWRYRGDLALIERLGIKDRIHFTGWVSHDHLPAFYNLADLFVLPSLYEGFGIPLLEAMACGRPVVAAQVGALIDIVLDGTSGVLVPPDDPRSLARAVNDLLSDPVRLDGFGLAAADRVRARHGWAQIGSEITNSYERVLAE